MNTSYAAIFALLSVAILIIPESWWSLSCPLHFERSHHGVVYYNCSIFTSNEQHPPFATGFRVRNGIFVEVGDGEELRQLHSKDRKVNLKAAWVAPGFVDPHVHFMSGAHTLPQDRALSAGITALGDMGSGNAWDDLEHLYLPLANAGQLRLRIRVFVPLSSYERMAAMVDTVGSFHPSGRLFWGGVEASFNGSRADEFQAAIANAHRAGLQVAVHALGDVDRVFAAFQGLDAGPLRHRIDTEHQVILVARDREIFPRDILLLQRGPVEDQDWPTAPLHQMRSAVQRGVRPAVALKALTHGAAYANRLDKLVGTIEVGKRADFVVYNSSILDWLQQDGVPHEDAPHVLQTYIDGVCEYEK